MASPIRRTRSAVGGTSGLEDTDPPGIEAMQVGFLSTGVSSLQIAVAIDPGVMYDGGDGEAVKLCEVFDGVTDSSQVFIDGLAIHGAC